MKTCLSALLVLALAVPTAAQEKPQNHIVDEARGFFVQKPKDEAWEIKTEGGKVYKDVVAVVSHRVETFTVEVAISTKAENQTFGKLEDVAKNVITNFENDKDGKAIEGRKVRKRKGQDGVFPGAGGPKAYYLEIEIEENNNKTPIRFWLWIDKQNPNHLFQVCIFGSDELAKKFDRETKQVMASMKTFKVKR